MINTDSTNARRAVTLLLVLYSVWGTTRPVAACTTVMVGKRATEDGSVLMASSCDGDVMGLIYVMPAKTYPPDTKLPMYWNVPRPKNYEEYQANVRRGYDLVGYLPTTETYRSIILAGNVESMTTGGLNEHGLSIAIEFLPMRAGLACDRGVVGPNSNHWTTSLIANGLLRAKTAREAIRVIGSMIDEYGFLYYRAPSAGVALPIADDQETWLMEIFGPGENWTPDSGKPGGVWCAQRIPDGQVGCSANRSRIGKVDLDDEDHFMASANIFSLAQELKFWQPGQPFVWYEAYGGPGSKYNSLREWRALSLAAPSLGLKATGDPAVDRYPFSVKPDKPIEVRTLMDIMRDGYEGTPFDLTKNPAFQTKGHKSPLARPWGSAELFDLLDVRPERAICTPTSGYVFIAQLRDALPDPIGNCLWFAYGPANTSCFVPVYAGATELPDSWDQPADFTRIDRKQPQWNFRLVQNLTNNLRYQDAIKDVQHVLKPAEERFLGVQPELEKAASRIFEKHGAQRAEAFLNDYAQQSMMQAGHAYHELVDYLMFRYLIGDKELAQPPLPRIAAPVIPDKP
ncbi:MAG: C69 family dipeptidase [Planctomycetes bacterium]|nr:C69 family dipeptidase [Planctomycetota bacterium]MBL7037613.1 C69 family dipeptidase [Pirellulaceae bacterium]